jgi:acyl carrier protein
VPPRTPLEEEIASIWEDILGVEGVGVRDDFFELGGHSLLATRVLARIHDDFGIRLPLQTVFEGPTVEDLTRVMGERLLAGIQVS